MAGYHTVRQGEHLARVAREYGFADYDTIWNNPNNAELREKRKNPNVLFPGDLLYVPDRIPKEVFRATDDRHRFKVKKPKLELRLTLGALYDRPRANTACVLAIEIDLRNVTTDGEGRLDEPIPPDAERATLFLRDSGTLLVSDAIPIRVGYLDPAEEVTGQQARLNNLGYYAGKIGETDAEALRSAVEEFQCEHELKVDGICGAQTQERLRVVHGC